MSLACTHMKMTPAEAVAAATVNGACALGIQDRKGSIEPGKWADLMAPAVNQLCSSCHPQIWAQFQRPYKHRLPEGAMSCVDCHNPHDPRFKPIQPLPPPVRPERIR